MFKIQINRSEIDELQEYIAKHGSKETQDKVLDRAAELTERLARDVYAPHLSGELRASIKRLKIASNIRQVRCDAPYAEYHEYGSYNIQVGSVENPRKVKTGYSPFLRPAAWKTMSRLQEIYEQIINE